MSDLRRFENLVSFGVQINALHPMKGIAAKLQKRDSTDIDTFHDRCYRCYSEAKLLAAEIDSVEEKPRTIQGGNGILMLLLNTSREA